MSIERRLDEAPLDLFDEARKHIKLLMQRDPYRRFVELLQSQVAVDLDDRVHSPQSSQRHQKEFEKPTATKAHRRRGVWPWQKFNWKKLSRDTVGSENPGYHGDSERVVETDRPASETSTRAQKKSKSAAGLIGRFVSRLSTMFSSSDRHSGTPHSTVDVLHDMNSTVCTTSLIDVTMNSTVCTMSPSDVTFTSSRDVSRFEMTSKRTAVDSPSNRRSNGCRHRREKLLSSRINEDGRLDRSSTRLQRFRQTAFKRGDFVLANRRLLSKKNDDVVVTRSTVPLEDETVSGACVHRGHKRLRDIVGSLTTRRQSDSGISSASDNELSEHRGQSLRPGDDDVRRLTIYFL